MNLNSLRSHFPKLVFEENENLANYVYMKVGGRAAALVDVREKQDLADLTAFCFTQKIPFLVLGGGSNTIFPDEGIDRLVIHNLTSSIEFKHKNEEMYEVSADSGVVTAVLAAKTAAQELTGLEYFVGVPGTVGGAIKNNSHFSADDLIGDRVMSVEVMTPSGKREVWDREKLKFAYDYSILHDRPDVVLSAVFLLRRAPVTMIEEHIKKAALKRTSTQPIGIPSSGCMFKNPKVSLEKLNALMAKLELPEGAFRELDETQAQIAAGFLIDSAGLKGKRVGGAVVSEKHATYILNDGGATASDVEMLCRIIEREVEEKFGVKLEREVFFVKD